MENWIFLLLGLLLGIPINYFVAFTSPWLKSYFEKRSLTLRERELDIIQNKYKLLKGLNKFPEAISIALAWAMIKGILLLTFLVSGIGVFILISISQSISNPLAQNIILFIEIGFIVFVTYLGSVCKI